MSQVSHAENDSGRSRLPDLMRALRPIQWAKNLLLFVPLALTPDQWGDADKHRTLFFAFVAFSLCASAGYILNDLLDRDADRAHPQKSKRPFASGRLPVAAGVASMLVLLAIAFAAALNISDRSFLSALGIYLAVTAAYSIALKRLLLVDVITLAGLYTLRVIAGAIAVSIEPTSWLLAFSLFIFLSLAFVKRYSELDLVGSRQEILRNRRAYEAGDLDLVRILGSTSGYLSVLVLCLYINSEAVQRLYQNVHMLWFLCPILLYWISRIWFMANRGQIPGDPVAFAVRDPVSLVTGFLAAAVIAVAVL